MAAALAAAWPQPGRCRAVAWPVPGRCLAAAWPQPGHSLAAAWPQHGRSLATAWPQPGRCLAVAWPLPGRSLAAAWPLPGRSLPAAWPQPGRSLAAAWPQPGRSLAVAWPQGVLRKLDAQLGDRAAASAPPAHLLSLLPPILARQVTCVPSQQRDHRDILAAGQLWCVEDDGQNEGVSCHTAHLPGARLRAPILEA